MRKFDLLANLDNLFPSAFTLDHLLGLVVLHKRLEVRLLERLEIHSLRNLLDGFGRQVEAPADNVQAVRGTAESRLRCKETMRKDGPHLFLFLKVILEELAEVVVVKQML